MKNYFSKMLLCSLCLAGLGQASTTDEAPSASAARLPKALSEELQARSVKINMASYAAETTDDMFKGKIVDSDTIVLEDFGYGSMQTYSGYQLLVKDAGGDIPRAWEIDLRTATPLPGHRHIIVDMKAPNGDDIYREYPPIAILATFMPETYTLTLRLVNPQGNDPRELARVFCRDYAVWYSWGKMTLPDKIIVPEASREPIIEGIKRELEFSTNVVQRNKLTEKEPDIHLKAHVSRTVIYPELLKRLTSDTIVLEDFSYGSYECQLLAKTAAGFIPRAWEIDLRTTTPLTGHRNIIVDMKDPRGDYLFREYPPLAGLATSMPETYTLTFRLVNPQDNDPRELARVFCRDYAVWYSWGKMTLPDKIIVPEASREPIIEGIKRELEFSTGVVQRNKLTEKEPDFNLKAHVSRTVIYPELLKRLTSASN